MAHDSLSFEDLTASAFAARFGVTPRALRVYEKAGLLKPPRTAAGWRVYGPEEADRLYRIMALKALGLSLARIGDALELADLSGVLAVQEDALQEAQTSAGQGLKLVRAARRRLADGASLSADDLVNLIKETAMNTSVPQNDRYVALVQRHFGPNVQDAMRVDMSLEEMNRLRQDWLDLIADGERVRQGDPAGEAAQDFLTRLEGLIDRTVRDEDDRRRHAALFEEGYSDPKTAPQMPFSAELYAFIQEARAHRDALDGAV